MKLLLVGSILSALAACAVDDAPEGTSEAVELVTNTIGPAYIYPAGAGLYRVRSLVGDTVRCDDGQYAPSCLADALDFSQMALTYEQRTDLRDRFAIADSSLANVSVIVSGQWTIVTVRDHRDPPRYYRRVNFQLLSAYRAGSVGLHSTEFYRLSGVEAQMAQPVTSTHTLPFLVTIEFPGPIIANSYGVVSDGYISGSVAIDGTRSSPVELVADRYFQRL